MPYGRTADVRFGNRTEIVRISYRYGDMLCIAPGQIAIEAPRGTHLHRGFVLQRKSQVLATQDIHSAVRLVARTARPEYRPARLVIELSISRIQQLVRGSLQGPGPVLGFLHVVVEFLCGCVGHTQIQARDPQTRSCNRTVRPRAVRVGVGVGGWVLGWEDLGVGVGVGVAHTHTHTHTRTRTHAHTHTHIHTHTAPSTRPRFS